MPTMTNPTNVAQLAGLTDAERTELLDWVSACQSAYHIDSTPGHRFGGLGSNLEENRQAIIEYVESIINERVCTLTAQAPAAAKPQLFCANKIVAEQWGVDEMTPFVRLFDKATWVALLLTVPEQAAHAPVESEFDYRRGYRDGYNRRDDEVKAALT